MILAKLYRSCVWRDFSYKLIQSTTRHSSVVSSYRMLQKIVYHLKGEHLSIYFYFSRKAYTISELLSSASVFVQCTFHGRAGHLYFVSRGIIFFFIKNRYYLKALNGGKRTEEVYPLHACLPVSPHALTCLIQQLPGIMSSWKHTIRYSKDVGRFSAFPKQFFRRQWLNCSWIYTKWNNRQRELIFFLIEADSCSQWLVPISVMWLISLRGVP